MTDSRFSIFSFVRSKYLLKKKHVDTIKKLLLVPSRYRKRVKLRPDEPLDTCTDLTLTYIFRLFPTLNAPGSIDSKGLSDNILEREWKKKS